VILRSSLIGLAVFGVAAAAEPGEAPLRAMRWLAPGADAVQAMTREPVECLSEPIGDEARWRVEIGRAAFRSPLTLGGQAARAGVSCETCHQNGRANPNFFFPGVSGAPGTADVTSSLFSSHRGDGVDNPRPIPDLGGPRAALRVSRDPADPALRTFVHGLVTQEFDGFEPTPAVMEGLTLYVRALIPAACDAHPTRQRSVAFDWANAQRAVAAGEHALRSGDRETASAMLIAARSELGLISERYDRPDLQGLRDDVRRHAIALASIRMHLEDRNARQNLARWRRDGLALSRRLRAQEARSLYNPEVLRAAIAEASSAAR
jgi:hypothetical protein